MIGLFPADGLSAWVIDIGASNISKETKVWKSRMWEKLRWLGTKARSSKEGAAWRTAPHPAPFHPRRAILVWPSLTAEPVGTTQRLQQPSDSPGGPGLKKPGRAVPDVARVVLGERELCSADQKAVLKPEQRGGGRRRWWWWRRGRPSRPRRPPAICCAGSRIPRPVCEDAAAASSAQ